jgi:hypothetical protein
MNVETIVRSVSPTATQVEISAGGHRVFRLREEEGATSIVKVYSTPTRERRERHALVALDQVQGVPKILSRGIDEGTAWIQMTDGGNWDLATLPRNLNILRSAGRVLRGVHESNAALTNLNNVIDNEQVGAHFRNTIERLNKYRRRLSLPSDVLDQAASAGPPVASPGKPAHTRPFPNQFLVTEAGQVTLVDWEWATIAPPEWDVSLASWQFSKLLGDEAASAFLEGYGAVVSATRLKSWIAYHSAMLMLEAAEKRDGRLQDMAPLVADLAEAVGVG